MAMYITFPRECGAEAAEDVRWWLREIARIGRVINDSHKAPSPGKVLFLLSQMPPADVCNYFDMAVRNREQWPDSIKKLQMEEG